MLSETGRTPGLSCLGGSSVKSQQFVVLGLAMAGAVVLDAPARAVPITIVNPSFENPDTGTSGFSNNVVNNWTGTCSGSCASFSYGVYSPVSPTQYEIGLNGLASPHIVPDQDQAAYISASATLSQTLTTTLTNSTTYSLSVWVGNRKDFTGFPSTLSIQLLAGATVAQSLALTALPGEGLWKQYTLTYTSGAADPLAGQLLGIALVDGTGGSSAPQVNFDLVTLNAETATTAAPLATAPEPMTIALFGAALIGFGAVRRRFAAR